MEEVRYYYSTTGEDIHGPITDLALEELFRENAVDATTRICREGDTEWMMLNPEMFPVVMEAEPDTSSASRRKSRKSKRKSSGEPWINREKLGYLDTRRKITGICWVGSLAGAALLVHLRYVVFAATQVAPDSVFEVIGYFIGAAALIAALAFLFSLLFEIYIRQLVRMIAIICLALLLPIAEFIFLDMYAGDHPADATADPNAIVLPP